MTSRRSIIYVVDDDASMRRSVELLLRSAGLEVETFADPRTFLETALPSRPACLVLDVMMPELSGLELQERLRARASELPIVFVTGQGTVRISVEAFKAGAVDFLEKPFEDEALLTAVREAIRRHTASLADVHEQREAAGHYACLTPREREVFTLVVKGLSNGEVAHALGIAEATVKIHRGRIMHKMDVDSLADLVRIAERFDLD